MRLQNIGVLATLFGLAPAFLVPPSISEADTDIINTLPFEDAIAMDGRVMDVACPGCPVVSSIEGKTHVAQADSVLKLNFSLSHPEGAERDALLLNGIQIYPIDPFAASFMEPLTANQMVRGENNRWELAAAPKLGYAVSIHHPATTDQDLNLIAVHLEIVEVADVFLTKIPQIDLKLLQTPSGKLMIGDAKILVAPKTALSAPSDDGQECTTILCKWQAIIADRISQLKGWKIGGCGGKKPSGSVTAVDEEERPEHGHHGPRPHFGGRPSHRPHPHHKHHGKHGGFARVLRGIVIHIFVPVLIGILCGITASLVGMFVGHIVIFVWRALFRRGEKATRYHRVKGEEAVTAKEGNEEEKSLIDNQGPPPEYVEAVGEEKQ